MSKIKMMLLTCCGLGKIPFAPGTCGSLGAAAAAAIIITLGIKSEHLLLALFFLLASSALLFWLGVKAADAYVKESGVEDPSIIVIDEWVGQMVTILLFIGGASLSSSVNGSFTKQAFTENHGLEGWLIGSALLGGLFLLFRFFDITKPSFAGWADKEVPGGLGVMLDDVFAGAYAAFTALAITWTISIII